ncbi:MAG: cytochrome c3 family protein [bacterium]
MKTKRVFKVLNIGLLITVFLLMLASAAKSQGFGDAQEEGFGDAQEESFGDAKERFGDAQEDQGEGFGDFDKEMSQEEPKKEITGEYLEGFSEFSGSEEELPVGGETFSKEKIMEALRNFEKMSPPPRRKVDGTFESIPAKENPVWKFHGWLQEQIELMDISGGQGRTDIEELCFVCHNGQLVINYNFSGDPSVPGVKQHYSLRSHHPVQDRDKSTFYDPKFPNDPSKSDPIWARKIQCTSCHNPGVITGKTKDGGYPLTLPTDDTMPWMQKLIDGWPSVDTPPWPHDTPPRPMVYGQPFLHDPDPDIIGDEVLGPDANQLPDYTTYCQTCHRQVSGRYGSSNNYSRLKYDPIRFIKGDGGGMIATHGLARGRESSTEILHLREPFYSRRTDAEGNVVNNLYLACTDCHEPHGSYNVFLLRTKVNGREGVVINPDGRLFSLCNCCHYIENPWPGGYPHGGPGDMTERVCIECHNHNAGGGRF